MESNNLNRQQKDWTWAMVAVVVLVTAAILVYREFGDRWVSADTESPEVLARGKIVYGERCASCHGAKLEGQPDWRIRRPDGRLPAPPHDASGHTWHHPMAVLFEMVKEGIGKNGPPGYLTDMPAFGATLSDADIRASLAYIKSTWPQEIRRRHDVLERASRDSR
jgi:mono/diheme cytochrome c family protein